MAVFHEIKKLHSPVNWFFLLIVLSVAPILLNPNTATLCYSCYAQDAQPPWHHKVAFFSIGCPRNDCCPISSYFLTYWNDFRFGRKGLSPDGTISRRGMLLVSLRGHHHPCVPLFSAQDGHARRHHHQVSVISLPPALVIRYVWLLHMLMCCVHILAKCEE
jgi:hypothetical protein